MIRLREGHHNPKLPLLVKTSSYISWINKTDKLFDHVRCIKGSGFIIFVCGKPLG